MKQFKEDYEEHLILFLELGMSLTLCEKGKPITQEGQIGPIEEEYIQENLAQDLIYGILDQRFRKSL